MIAATVLLYTLKCAVGSKCPCGDILPRPDLGKKATTARWMAHSLEWGVLTTMTSRFNESIGGLTPFGNVYSFIDGSCVNATGTPYFYGTYMDQSFQDMKENPSASFTLTEASLASTCMDASTSEFFEKACVISSIHTYNTSLKNAFPGDPESPVCARLTMVGALVEIKDDTEEYEFIQSSFFERHPQMKFWPTNHDWKIAKLVLKELWLIDYFGGATILTPEQYFEHDLTIISTDGK